MRTLVLAAISSLALLSCVDSRLPTARVSLLAVGDTGIPPDDEKYGNSLQVGRAMAQSDIQSEVDALVLLGDNFYHNGLRADELVARVRANVVAPFCHFVSLRASHWGQVDGACPSRERRRAELPIIAVLGNHDYLHPESPKLQRHRVPALLPNWRTPHGVAELFELGSGVSLVAADSEAVIAGEDLSPLRDALAASRGPWRILAMHRPLFALGSGDPRNDLSHAERVRAVIRAAGVGVQIILAAHEHNLQILAVNGATPARTLHVIAGGGSHARSIRVEHPDRQFSRESLGFARVDLVGTGDALRLVASLYSLRVPVLRDLRGPALVARWSVDLKERIRQEPI